MKQKNTGKPGKIKKNIKKTCGRKFCLGVRGSLESVKILTVVQYPLHAYKPTLTCATEGYAIPGYKFKKIRQNSKIKKKTR